MSDKPLHFYILHSLINILHLSSPSVYSPFTFHHSSLLYVQAETFYYFLYFSARFLFIVYPFNRQPTARLGWHFTHVIFSKPCYGIQESPVSENNHVYSHHFCGCIHGSLLSTVFLGMEWL